VRRIGKAFYFKGNKSFWNSDGDAASAAKLAGHWIKTTTAKKDFSEFIDLTSKDFLLEEFLDLTESDVETMKIIPGKSIDGQNTVGLSETPVGEETADSGVFLIAAAELALLMNVDIGTEGNQYFKFRSWNKPVNVTAPKGAVDFDNLATLL
jgi:hypothetical protein